MRSSALPDELMRVLLQGGSRRKAIRRFRQETGASRADALHAMNNFSPCDEQFFPEASVAIDTQLVRGSYPGHFGRCLDAVGSAVSVKRMSLDR